MRVQDLPNPTYWAVRQMSATLKRCLYFSLQIKNSVNLYTVHETLCHSYATLLIVLRDILLLHFSLYVAIVLMCILYSNCMPVWKSPPSNRVMQCIIFRQSC